MSRKPKEKEVEQEIDVKIPAKKETKVQRWFKQFAVDNATELKIACDLTARSAEEQFSLMTKSGNTEVFAVIYYATFMEILNFIRKKQKTYNQFSIEIANSINIGYTNNENDDNEKIGNFMPIMEYISINRNVIDTSGVLDSDKTTANFLMWKELNIKKSVEYYKEIQENAYRTLQEEYKVSPRTSEAIFPLFCIFQDTLASVLKMKYKEAEGTDISEISMNVFGLYDMYYSFNADDNQEIYEFQPNIAMKLALKQDDVAARD